MEAENKHKIFVASMIVLLAAAMLFVANISTFFPSPDIEIPFSNFNTNTTFFNSLKERGTNPVAEVVFIEFFDFTCPYCAESFVGVKQLVEEYSDRVNFVFVIIPPQTESEKAAMAAECAKDQGKFNDYAALLFFSQRFEVADLKGYAAQLQIDQEQFDECLDSGAKKTTIDENVAQSQIIGIRGTPTFFINGKAIEGVAPYQKLRTIIDAELENENSI